MERLVPHWNAPDGGVLGYARTFLAIEDAFRMRVVSKPLLMAVERVERTVVAAQR
jgi:hypothetical protein